MNRSLCMLALVAATASAMPVAARGNPGERGYAQRAEVRAFAREAAAETGLSEASIARSLAVARYQPKIIELMNRPLVVPPKWFEYAPQFINGERIVAGTAFWRANATTLARAEAQFGVPAQIIVAIIGVETYWGRITGSYRTLDALATLSFDYPRRAAFFRGELKQYLQLASEQRWVPASRLGSFAGAMGLPQFMPGSYRAYAVDFDGDGRVDLWNSAADTIGSVANYLARHDWSRDQPVLLPAHVTDAARDGLLRRLDGGLSERRSLAAWRQEGVVFDELPQGLAADPAGILMLEDDADNASLYLACNNFYVITRYNKSRLYAAAVWKLANALDAMHRVEDDSRACAGVARGDTPAGSAGFSPAGSFGVNECPHAPALPSAN